jgi:PAS domain S-box-containing protein
LTGERCTRDGAAWLLETGGKECPLQDTEPRSAGAPGVTRGREDRARPGFGSPSLIGPLLGNQPIWIRYGVALLLVAAMVAARFALIPLMGAQAPLLPFVLVVFAAGYLAGFGPALFAALLSPALITLMFTRFPFDGDVGAWSAHVALFMIITVLVSLIVHQLQVVSRSQQDALASAHAAERAAARELTERRHVEEALRKSEGMLKLIYDNTSDSMFLVEADSEDRFTFVTVNDTFLSVTGFERERVIGRPVEEPLTQENSALLLEKIHEAIATRVPIIYYESGELPAGRRYGEVTLVPIAGAGGQMTHVLGSVKDVTARKQAEDALREADRRKDEFLVMLAHELRNPLAPIMNVAHILSADGVDPQSVRRNSEMLRRQASQLSRLVDDLLDVARITRGMIELKNERLAIDRILDRAIESVQPMLNLKKQSVSYARPSAALHVEGDGVRLVQVFANLLSNAVKYSAERTVIQVIAEQTDGCVTVRIIDSGIGIDPQMLPQVFELFMQADRSLDRREGGLGVGLTVVKHLVELHGGTVQALSTGLGQGSEFVVRLPLVSMSAPDVAAPAAPTEKAHSRILIVEDNVDSAESLAMLLRLEGHDVRAVHDGTDALRELEGFPATFVLLDIGLPNMDGYVVAQAIRERFPQTPMRLYALTGYGRDEDKALAASSGFDGHLTKPVDPARLLDIIAGSSESHRSADYRAN